MISINLHKKVKNTISFRGILIKIIKYSLGL